MQTILAGRACAILFDLLMARNDRRPWLMPANICPIVPITFCKAGVPFEFVDISPETFHMDLDQAESRLRNGGGVSGGLIYVHTYGEPSTPQDFFRTVKSRYPDLLLVDDRCLCIPDFACDPAACADVTLFSTGYSKIVDLGTGGYAFLQDHVVYIHHALAFQARDLEQVELDYK